MKETGYKVAFFIGNGFDCDLGLKTKYSDFVNSDYFRRNLTNNYNHQRLIEEDYDFSIFDYLFYKYNKNQKWIDIEHELLSLATREYRIIDMKKGNYQYVLPKSKPKQKETFDLLKKELNDYLLHIDYNINKNSNSYKLFDLINKSTSSKIISFNYTFLEGYYGINHYSNNKIFHVHGCLNDNDPQSIILGFQDDVDIDKSYCYMIKSHQPNYYSSHISDILKDVDEVIFFGLSLGDVDYPYFSDFFKKQCIPNNKTERKFISFFTYDEDSRQELLFQLRIMNEKKTRYFFEYSNLNFFRTKNNIDNDKITSYIDDLRRRLFLD